MFHSQQTLYRSLPLWGASTIKILVVLSIAAALILPQGVVSAAAPYTVITGIIPDVSITVQTYNFPANQAFTVRMGEMNTRGVGGTVVAITDSGSGGSFSVTYKIPSNMLGKAQISLRLESAEGYYAYDWFNNVAGGTSTTGSWTAWAAQPSDYPVTSSSSTSSSTTTYVSYGTPSMEVTNVEPDDSITIKVYKFPSNQTFTARMGKWGTQGVNGTVVGTMDSGDGGSFTLTYDIPDGLLDESKIAIRLESPQGYYVYDWFTNE